MQIIRKFAPKKTIEVGINKLYIPQHNNVILVIMELGEMFFMIITSCVVNIVVIVGLYTYWIIPEIVERVRDELMENIQKWIADTRDDLKNTITINVDEMRQKVVGVITGHRGNKARQLSLATQFLTANLDDLDNLETEDNESIITQAIAQYGERIVKAALKSIKANSPQPAAAEDGGIW